MAILLQGPNGQKVYSDPSSADHAAYLKGGFKPFTAPSAPSAPTSPGLTNPGGGFVSPDQAIRDQVAAMSKRAEGEKGLPAGYEQVSGYGDPDSAGHQL